MNQCCLRGDSSRLQGALRTFSLGSPTWIPPTSFPLLNQALLVPALVLLTPEARGQSCSPRDEWAWGAVGHGFPSVLSWGRQIQY